ncbi:MAG: hypothetical protein HY075_00600, partial [Deltaproteobacteria bacterium]|nr:hypothetical protein [Deltaproteobacteria bacterium]
PCFKSVFETTPGGSYLVRGAELPRYDEPAPDGRWYATVTQAFLKINTSPLCPLFGPDRDGVTELVQKLHAKVAPVFASSAYGRLIKPRYQRKAELDYEIPGGIDSGGLRLRELVGASLFDRYLALLKRFHFRSPDFDCEAARLFPLKGAAAMGALLGTPAGKACHR